MVQASSKEQRLAEGVGFEPTVSCPTHAFQACRFGRSRTPPGHGRHRAASEALRSRVRLSCRRARSRRWRSGPVQSEPVNRVRAGRQQLSAEPPVCRRSPGRHMGSGSPDRSGRGSAATPPGAGAASGSVPVGSPPMAYQSLYRRYRPQRFAEVRGQDHVVARAAQRRARGPGRPRLPALSGPRGTGKTSTARILAKALNCADLADGEPCGVCELVRGHRGRPLLRRPRARRRLQQRRRRHPRPASRRSALGLAGAHQGVHPRRGPHALARRRPTRC